MASATTKALVNQPLIEPTSGQKREQLLKILNSRAFQNGPLLQKFLEFVVLKSIDGRPEDLNEYALATQVLGRRGDFDPALDTSVRTQAYRLRTKLREYYVAEGKTDPIFIDIPKGHYRPKFSAHPDRFADLGSDAAIATAIRPHPWIGIETRDRAPGQSRGRLGLTITGLIFLGIVMFLGGMLVGRHKALVRSATSAADKIDESLAEFWRCPSSESGIVLAFTNPVFLETNNGDLLRYRGGAVADRGAPVGREDSETTALDSDLARRAGPLHYEDGFTGTGEVIAVHRLTDLLRTLDVKLTVERSRVFSATDFRSHDVVFLGSPVGNQILHQIAIPKRFVFDLPQSAPYLWQGDIVDTGTGNSAKRSYEMERDPQTHVILTDYALFDVFPGPSQDHRVILLAGMTTTGTQGAANFATSPEGLRLVRDLVGASDEARKTVPAYFECLLRVDAVGGLDAVKVIPVSCSSLQRDK